MFLFLSVFKCVSSTYSSESVGQLLTNYLPNTIRFDQGDEETWPDKKSKKRIFEVFLAFASYKLCKFFGNYGFRFETFEMRNLGTGPSSRADNIWVKEYSFILCPFLYLPNPL